MSFICYSSLLNDPFYSRQNILYASSRIQPTFGMFRVAFSNLQLLAFHDTAENVTCDLHRPNDPLLPVPAAVETLLMSPTCSLPQILSGSEDPRHAAFFVGNLGKICGFSLSCYPRGKLPVITSGKLRRGNAGTRHSHPQPLAR